ncbi:hypothetical protein [Curtobacterium luteum]|uniref:hypothetical protein n=1 Tax=Curtobacterium luteum TaxID=33881 RepID=UPI00381E3D00
MVAVDVHVALTPEEGSALDSLQRRFVMCVLRTVAPEADERSRLVAPVAALVRWAWDAGLPLRTEMVFAVATVEYFCEVHCRELSAPVRTARRRLLRRVAAELRAGPPPRCGAVVSAGVGPYSPEERMLLINWARSFTTTQAGRDAHVLLALGLGAGLTASEVIGLRWLSVRQHASGIDVVLNGGRGRTVPVLSAFAAVLAAGRSDPERFVFRPARHGAYVNAITNFTARSTGLRPQMQRMRTTWLTHHLHAGTPIDVLLPAAGLPSTTTLERYLRYLEPREPGWSADRLRFPESEVGPPGARTP